MAYAKVQASFDNKTPLTKIEGQIVVRLAATSKTEVQVLVPWVSNRIAAGYDMDASITIPPTMFSVDLDMTQPQAKLIKYELNNRRQQEVSIF